MSNIAFLFLPLAFSSLPAVLPFVSPSSQIFNRIIIAMLLTKMSFENTRLLKGSVALRTLRWCFRCDLNMNISGRDHIRMWIVWDQCINVMVLVGRGSAQGTTTGLKCRFKTGKCVLQNDPRWVEANTLKAIRNRFMREMDWFTNHASMMNIDGANQFFETLLGDPHFKDAIF